VVRAVKPVASRTARKTSGLAISVVKVP
jgi:hypothetical protein